MAEPLGPSVSWVSPKATQSAEGLRRPGRGQTPRALLWGRLGPSRVRTCREPPKEAHDYDGGYVVPDGVGVSRLRRRATQPPRRYVLAHSSAVGFVLPVGGSPVRSRRSRRSTGNYAPATAPNGASAGGVVTRTPVA